MIPIVILFIIAEMMFHVQMYCSIVRIRDIDSFLIIVMVVFSILGIPNCCDSSMNTTPACLFCGFIITCFIVAKFCYIHTETRFVSSVVSNQSGKINSKIMKLTHLYGNQMLLDHPGISILRVTSTTLPSQ